MTETANVKILTPFDYLTSNLVSEAAIQSRARRTVRRILENSVEKTYDSADF